MNVIRAGANYGWPVVTYGRNYGFGTKIGEGTHKEGMVPPLHQWTPSIAPSGMAFYDGDKFPEWRWQPAGRSPQVRLLARLEFEGERFVREERMLEDVIGRIRDVRVGPDGYVYLLNDASDGVIRAPRTRRSVMSESRKPRTGREPEPDVKAPAPSKSGRAPAHSAARPHAHGLGVLAASETFLKSGARNSGGQCADADSLHAFRDRVTIVTRVYHEGRATARHPHRRGGIRARPWRTANA